MYLKILVRGNTTYYILCVKDSNKNKWVERFVTSRLAQVLIDENIKVVER